MSEEQKQSLKNDVNALTYWWSRFKSLEKKMQDYHKTLKESGETERAEAFKQYFREQVDLK